MMSAERKDAVLVADDRIDGLGHVVAKLFVDFDLELLTAESGEEAIRIMRETEHRILGVLTDMNMEEPDAGAKVVAAAKQLDPAPVTCIMSGHAEDPRIAAAEPDIIIQKSPNDIYFEAFFNALKERVNR